MSRDQALRHYQDSVIEHQAARRQAARDRHAELVLAAIAAEGNADRMDDKQFRAYVNSLTAGLDLPTRAGMQSVSSDLPPAA